MESDTLTARVAIIGGGAAGLSCAQELRRLGFAPSDAIVCEARSVLGGRIHQTSSLYPPLRLDLGAELVHGEETSLVRLADALGWKRTAVFCWAQGDGGPSDEAVNGGCGLYYLGREKRMLRFDAEDGDFQRLNEMLWGLCEKDVADPAFFADDRSLAAFLEAEGCPPRMMGMAAAGYANTHCGSLEGIGYAGAALEERGWLVDGEGDSRFDASYFQLTEHLSRGVRSLTDFAAALVEQRVDGGLRVVSSDGREVRCERVVCTAPTTVMQRGAIAFSPPLPQQKVDAWAKVGMDRAIKLLLLFRRPVAPPSCHGVICADCDIPEFWFRDLAAQEQDGDGAFLAVAFATGAFAERLAALGAAEMRRLALAQLQEMFGMGAEGAFLRSELCDWGEEPHIWGGYTYPRVGFTPQVKAELAAPTAEGVHFAGEATSQTAGMTVHSAMDSGVRAAGEVHAALCGDG